jgi:hypothetical protein
MKIKAPIKSKKFIRMPPILKIIPISQNRIIKPPNHRKKAIIIPPLNIKDVIILDRIEL